MTAAENLKGQRVMFRKADDPEEDRDELWGTMQACVGTVRNRLKSGLYTLKDMKECDGEGVVVRQLKCDPNKYTEHQVSSCSCL